MAANGGGASQSRMFWKDVSMVEVRNSITRAYGSLTSFLFLSMIFGFFDFICQLCGYD
jgi:hypothetical protein